MVFNYLGFALGSHCHFLPYQFVICFANRTTYVLTCINIHNYIVMFVRSIKTCK